MIDAFLTSPDECPNLRRLGLRPPSTSLAATSARVAQTPAAPTPSPQPAAPANVAAIHHPRAKKRIGALIVERVRDVRFPTLTAAAA